MPDVGTTEDAWGNEVDEPREVTFQPPHPGCQSCGRQPGPWTAPSSQWNLVRGGPTAKFDPGGMFCASCYLDLAYQVFPDSVFVVEVQTPEWQANENRELKNRRRRVHA